MKCPVCPSSQLVMTERSGVEIDYCPSCRGVWLDRGELDKIIERVGPAAPSAPAHYPAAPQSHYGKRAGYHKPPKSWLAELFD